MFNRYSVFFFLSVADKKHFKTIWNTIKDKYDTKKTKIFETNVTVCTLRLQLHFINFTFDLIDHYRVLCWCTNNMKWCLFVSDMSFYLKKSKHTSPNMSSNTVWNPSCTDPQINCEYMTHTVKM